MLRKVPEVVVAAPSVRAWVIYCVGIRRMIAHNR